MNNKTKQIIFMVVVIGGVIGIVYLLASHGGKTNDVSRAAGEHSASDASSREFSKDDLVGKLAPKFSLTDINGKEYSNERLKGKNVILFFNEGLMCYPACWNQIAKFGSDSRFNSSDTVALAVVVDPKKDWGQAIAKMPELAAATTLFDDGGYASRAFNVLKTPSSMHYGTLPGHTYVLIDKEGIVREVFDDPRMAIRNDELFTKIQGFNK